MDHCPDASVILREGATLMKVPARLLLPVGYRR